MESQLLEHGFAPLTTQSLAEFFEAEEKVVNQYPEFFSKLFYLYKTTGDSAYLALSMLPDVDDVRRKVDRDFAELLGSVNNTVVFEFTFLTRDDVRGDAFTDAVRQKVREKGKEVLIIKTQEGNGYWHYSIVVIPASADIELLDIDELGLDED